ncbi:hypothetical protein A7Q01_00235 [Eikenella sp. NML96-A-049]|uniref:hypothetical protein n=1 Tax=Eikenella TaxID=538 RepID=UPI0007E2A462|nr:MULTISPECIES: hypothetical protein [Eikenella]VDH01223.1 Uncharacterised protein [Helicobacter pametensis]OAM35525.1 hypothetical protein A7P97_00115 [Eikenella sp. NML070372]OAM35995.1 hypothetical protein A7P98_05385 [Eikenella sp. NML080894]OAM37847.1 hypothetical protein A7P99_05560 [Eikenella sp. NML120348]OAM43299.1 hypothetical protein A7Q01_00235 [Eikenella sp. NML96-A-049]
MWDVILTILSPFAQYIDSRKVRLYTYHIPATAVILFGWSAGDWQGMLQVWWIVSILLLLWGWMAYDLFHLRQEQPESQVTRLCLWLLPATWLLKTIISFWAA